MKNKKLSAALAVAELLVGMSMTAAAFGLIIIPQNFTAAGVTGFSGMICGALHLPLSAVVLAMNLALLLVGLVFVGKAFVARTVAVSLLFPALLEAASRYPLDAVAADPLLSSVLAGGLLGVGSGLVLRSGASSGGFDILAVALNRKLRIPISVTMNIIDCGVILMQAVGRPLLNTIYGVIVITVSAALVGQVVTLGSGECQILIFSEHSDEIKRRLLHELDVGVTSLQAVSGYKERTMEVLLTVMPYGKVSEMKAMVGAVDPTAFVVIDRVQNVLGKGYTLDKYM